MICKLPYARLGSMLAFKLGWGSIDSTYSRKYSVCIPALPYRSVRKIN